MDFARQVADGALDLLLSGLRNEVDQMAKFATPTSPRQHEFARATSSEGEPLLRSRLLADEASLAAVAQAKSANARERTLRAELAQLRRENDRLAGQVDRLRWEPKRARDTLVQLGVALSAAFAVVVFPLFALADRHLAADAWADRLQGRLLVVLGSMLCAGAAPLTHLSGQFLYDQFNFRFFQPGQGGRTYVLLQAFAWASYAIFLTLACTAFVVPDEFPGMVTAAGVAGIVAQTLMVCSLLSSCPAEVSTRKLSDAVEGSSGESTAAGSDKEEEEDGASPAGSPQGLVAALKLSFMPRVTRLQELKSDARACGLESDFWFDSDLSWNVHSVIRLDSDTLLLGAFVLLQSTLVGISLALGAMAELGAASSETHKRVLGALSLLLLVVPAVLTHCLGGMLFNRASWAFVQPFAGGTRFVALQAATWALLGLSVVGQASSLGLPIYLFAGAASMKLRHAGLTAVLAHVLMVVSLSHYDPSGAAEKPREPKAGAGEAADEAVEENEALAKVAPEVRRAARRFRFAHVRDVDSLKALHVRMTERFVGRRAILGNTLVSILCNTQYVSFAAAAVGYYLPIPALCVLSLGNVCLEQPADTTGALVKHSLGICILTVLYSAIKTFNVRGTLRVVLLMAVTVVPLLWAMHCHRGSNVVPLLQLNSALYTWYVYSTYTGMPEMTGRREWHAFRRFRALWALFQDYHGAELVSDPSLDAYEARDGGAVLGSPESKVQQGMFCFHPHGIFPTSLIWLPNSPAFCDRFPGLAMRICAMTASVIHVVPMMRDISQWSGVRDVGRTAVEIAIREGRSPLLVVGGQSEMFESKSWPREITVHRGHRGFVRMAIVHGIPLIPVFSFGEHTTMDNLYLPRLQAWFKQRLGFPIPYLPYGRWGLPVNRRVPLSFCVGAPVEPRKKDPNPSREDINELHKRYFDALERLFEDNKARCGFPDHTIEWAE